MGKMRIPRCGGGKPLGQRSIRAFGLTLFINPPHGIGAIGDGVNKAQKKIEDCE